MNPAQIIARKRDGHALSPDQVAAFIGGYVRGDIPDYQMAALAMAICLRGMNDAEVLALTWEMVRSGETLQWSCGGPAKVDKHSTGGIGDKVSLVLTPLVACCGLAVPKISGRGLGPTGGTIDKLESIRGFRTDLTLAELQDITERVGCVIAGATPEFVPADRKLYRLRDVTATVPCVPLITASIMSKKLAEHLSALVLDVKFGSGAFMKTLPEARTLARSLVRVGRQMGLRTSALLSDMNQPLGRRVGSAVEVNESVDALSGHGPADLLAIVLALGSQLLLLSGTVACPDAAQRLLVDHLESGRALEKFREMVRAQGGDLDAPRPVARAWEIEAPRAGYVREINAEAFGLAIIAMGGGRRVITDSIDPSVGIETLVRIGQAVDRAQPMLRVFSHNETADNVRRMLADAIQIGPVAPTPLPLIADRLTDEM